MCKAEVGSILQRVLDCDEGTGSSTTLISILHNFGATTFIPHATLSLPIRYGICVYPTSPFANHGTYASAMYEGRN